MRLLLAAGGSGGHVYPALAVADEARRRGHEVALLGGRDGPEGDLAAEAGVPFLGVTTGKWDRARPDPRQAWRAARGLGGALRRVRAWRPDVVAAFGGFASFPGCAAARLLRRPLVLHEGNALPGRVTRLFARSARLVAAAQPELARHLPRATVEPLGFPVREMRLDRAEARRRLDLPSNAPVTLVLGGSQGSRALNALVPEAFRALPDAPRPLVLHASGRRWEAELREATRFETNYRVTGYLDATLAWSAADLAITRAGVGTLSEAAFHGVPLIMVPLPSAAEDHQRHNARALVEAGAGRLVEEGDAAGLGEAWAALLQDHVRADASRAIGSRSPAGASARLLARIETLARTPSTHPAHSPGGPRA